MNFDNSVGTEDRFRLRRWLESFIEAHNQPENLDTFLSEELIVEGFTNENLSKPAFLEFIRQQTKSGFSQVRYPDLKIRYKDQAFFCDGSFQGLKENMLFYEGTVEMEVIKTVEDFLLDYFKFHPRLKVS